MSVTINGDTGIDKVQDGSIVADDLASTLDLSGKTITLATDAVDQLSTASGSAPSYSARAWVNFNGTGTVAIRASGNVSSITDHATGEYGINFTTAFPDANYAILFTPGGQETTSTANFETPRRSTTPTTTNVRIIFANGNQDALYGSVAVFR